MSKIYYFPYVLLALSPCVFAAVPPGAGSQLQQIPPAPVRQKSTPEIDIEQNAIQTIPKADHVRVLVKNLNITGAQAYAIAELLALTGFKPESELTLAELRGMAAKIAEYYHRNGYFVAQVYLPAQSINNGIVTIAVIEGHYGNITLHNKTNLSDKLAKRILNGLNNGDLIASAPLENRLLLLSDLPGVRIKSTLTPGASVGSSDLIVNVTPEQRVTGSIDADNAGNRYTGDNRIGASINLNNPAGLGDVATLRALASDSGLAYGRASYQIQWGKTKLGVAYSSLTYALGQDFQSLQANGTADIASLYGSYPLLRSRNNNLSIQLAFDAKNFQDKMNSTFSVTDKQVRVLMTSLNGDHRDNFYGGGLSSYSFTWASGNLDLQTLSMQSLDAATVQSNGAYEKFGFNAMRLQSITDSTSLYTSVNGQMASKNLDVSEKMELGGMYAVRAYPEGEAYADEGYVLTLELRTQLLKLSEWMGGKLQVLGFADSGTVTTNKNQWLVAQNGRNLNGAGLGLNWMGSSNFSVKSYYAYKLGSEVATSAPDATGRFWIQAVKYF